MKAAVFGGGIAGLLATLQLLNRRSVSEVILIENGPKLGVCWRLIILVNYK